MDFNKRLKILVFEKKFAVENTEVIAGSLFFFFFFLLWGQYKDPFFFYNNYRIFSFEFSCTITVQDFSIFFCKVQADQIVAVRELYCPVYVL